MSNIARIEALTSRIKGMKARAEAGASIGTQGLLTAGGGVIGGALEARMPHIPNTNMSTAGVLGGVGVLAAMSGFFGTQSKRVGQVCSGVLAYACGKEAFTYFS